jgi:dUTP pyrophosphatase
MIEIKRPDPDTPHFYLLPEAGGLYVDCFQPGGPRGDSGVDIRFADSCVVRGRTSLPVLVSLGVRARCTLRGKFVPYMLVPRSSISKTPLTLANSVGIIDSGYTGPLKVALHNHLEGTFGIGKGEALFQLVLPSLEPATFEVVPFDHWAFCEGASLRSEGGFGSTGVQGASAPQIQ